MPFMYYFKGLKSNNKMVLHEEVLNSVCFHTLKVIQLFNPCIKIWSVLLIVISNTV